MGLCGDAVIPSANIVILKMPDISKQVKVAMSQFRDLINDWKAMISGRCSSKNRMSQEEILAFVIELRLSLLLPPDLVQLESQIVLQNNYQNKDHLVCFLIFDLGSLV